MKDKKEDKIVGEWLEEDGSTTRKHKIGDTVYIVSSNHVPTEENKKRLKHTLERIQGAQIDNYIDKYRRGKLDEMLANLEKEYNR
ncbi:hypothetical protein [Lactococcus lactis]|uniref:hypothetical protein n=1 Tax=Lactococcus lactis TaxID=1358 RepID=UPI003D1741F3